MKIIILLVICLSLVAPSLATLGVDVSSAVSTSDWQCIANAGYDFAIVRVYCSYGAVDPNGAQTIINARNGGISYVDGYIFPCYSCGNPAGQVQAAVSNLQNAGANFGMIWYDIEVYAWDSNQGNNQAFIQAMIQEGQSLGIKAGVYSSYYNWESIVGLGWDYPSSQGLPIWYAHYDNNPSYSDWTSFGGWGSPSIKQYNGNANVCGVGVDLNWY